MAGVGGLIRNYAGEFVGGFYTNIEVCSVIEAELWGAVSRLKLGLG